MTRTLTINKNVEQGLIEVLQFLLEKGKVKGVLTLKKISEDGAVTYALIATSRELKDSVPLFPLMPTNAGKLLSRFTMRGGTTEPVVAVIKPCELRAYIELVKREQGNLDNIFLISYTCGGVYPLKMATDGTIEKNLSKYRNSLKKGDIPEDVRPACKGCTEFSPYTADITVDLIGNNDLDTQCTLFLNTKKGEELTKGMKGDLGDRELDQGKLDAFLKKREGNRKHLFDDIDAKIKGVDGLVEIFGRCIGCHGCSRVCPICYCKLCEFESPESEFKPSNYESELRRRGALKIPPGTVYYHLGRLTHIGISCVSCGLCEDACPVDIPISIIFKKVGESIQNMFDYIPGKNVEEEIPLITFKQEEFAEIEE